MVIVERECQCQASYHPITDLVIDRYYGASSPYDELTVENLQLLTVKQAVADGVYFAQNVDFAFDTNHSSNAPQAPWVFSGGSYSGALSAWTASVAPGTFWAYHSSSAPVEAIEDYWQYFSPVQEGMATNCSKDVTLVIDYVDSILLNGTADEILALKTQFGMETLEHDDDFASVLQNGPWSWQELSNYSPYSEFFTFCDAVENVEAGAAVTPGPDGVGLEKALAGYAAWINDTIAGPDACTYYGYDEYDLSCYDSYDANNTIFTDITVDNAPNRQWNWILCNEPLNYWQDGAPEGRPTIVSRLVTAEYWERQCALFFPPTDGYSYGQAEGLTVTDVNEWSQGWDITNTTRLTWTNGEFDPWRTASVSSGYRPGGALKSTAEAPVNITPQGVHCYDLILKNGVNNAGVQAVIDTEVAQMVKCKFSLAIFPGIRRSVTYANRSRGCRVLCPGLLGGEKE